MEQISILLQACLFLAVMFLSHQVRDLNKRTPSAASSSTTEARSEPRFAKQAERLHIVVCFVSCLGFFTLLGNLMGERQKAISERLERQLRIEAGLDRGPTRL